MNARTVSIVIAPLLLALTLAACSDPGRLTAVEAQRDQLQERVATLESSLETAEAERQDAQDRVSELETSLADAQETADQATADRDALRNQVDRLEAVASSLREGQESDLEAQLALIEALLSRGRQDVTALTGRQGVLRDRLGLPEATGDVGQAAPDGASEDGTNEGGTGDGPGDATEAESEAEAESAPDSDSAPASEEAPSDGDEPAQGDDVQPAEDGTTEPGTEDGAAEDTTDGETEQDQEPSPGDEESDTVPMGA